MTDSDKIWRCACGGAHFLSIQLIREIARELRSAARRLDVSLASKKKL